MNRARSFVLALGTALAALNALGRPADSAQQAPKAPPTVSAGGYGVRLTHLQFSDDRSLGESPGSLAVRRTLDLGFSITGREVDPERIVGLRNVRVVDQAGRDALGSPADGEEKRLRTLVDLGAAPDERLQRLSIDWPYPAPEGIRSVEADLVLYRGVRRSRVELPLPTAGPLPEQELGEAQLQLSQVHFRSGQLEAAARLICPPSLDVSPASLRSGAQAVLPDGSRQPLRGEYSLLETFDGSLVVHQTLSARELMARPERLVWDLVFRSGATVALPVRFVKLSAPFAGESR